MTIHEVTEEIKRAGEYVERIPIWRSTSYFNKFDCFDDKKRLFEVGVRLSRTMSGKVSSEYLLSVAEEG